MPPSRERAKPITSDEVLPAEKTGKRSTSGIVAALMDDCIRIPGTNIRFGLDPIIGLFPGMGDTLSSLVGVTVISEATRKGAPKKALVAMAINILANAAVGSIPVAGDAFSVWFKSNRRNYDLLQKALADGDARRGRGNRWFGIALIAGVIIVVALIIVGMLTLLNALLNPASGPSTPSP